MTTIPPEGYLPIEHFQRTDDDHSTTRVRDMPYGKRRESLEIFPTEISFPPTPVNGTSAAYPVMITNDGYDIVIVSEIKIVGDFAVEGSLGAIQPGEHVTLMLTFNPQRAGHSTGGLYINSGGAAGEEFIYLSGGDGPGWAYQTRDQFVQAVVDGFSSDSGQVLIAEGYSYITVPGSTLIPDLPGYAPYGIASPQHFGVKGNGIANDTADMQTALNSGINLFVPAGIYLINCTNNYLLMTAASQKLYGAGTKSVFRNTAIAGTPACPLLIVEGPDCVIEDLAFQHNGAVLINPTMGNAQIGFGDCVTIAGDRCVVNRLNVTNAWGNGIGIGKMNRTTGIQTNGLPSFVKVSHCHTSYCGNGVEDHAATTFGIFNAGAGINNLTGGYACITACTDLYSTQNFIQDYAGGGTSTWVSCKGYGARKSRVGTYPNSNLTPGGQGFYSGGICSIFSMEIFDSEGDSFWFAGHSMYCQGINLFSKGSKQRGLLLNGKHNGINIQVLDSSYTHPGVYAAITVQGASAVTVDTFSHSSGLVLKDPHTSGAWHTYGVEVVGGGGSAELTAEGVMFGGYLNGTLAPYKTGGGNTYLFIVEGYKTPARSEFVSGRKMITWRTSDATLAAVGDSSGNGAFMVVDDVNTNKRLAFGYDAVRDRGVIQAIEANVIARPLELNLAGLPSQSPVAIGMPALLGSTAAMQVDGDVMLGGIGNGVLVNVYYDTATGTFKYLGNGYASMTRLNGANGLWEIWTAPNNTAGAGVLATLALRASFGASGKSIFNLNDYATDALAGAGGVPISGLYRTGNDVKIRIA